MKRIMSFFLVLVLISIVGGVVSASAAGINPQWYVTCESDGKIGGNLGNQQTGLDAKYQVNEAIANMEPGDEETFYIRVTNNYSSAVRWYMKNIVDRTLEDTGLQTKGGAYTYRLTYSRFNPASGARTGTEYELFNSDTVGENTDDGREGLKEANNLEGYMFLDTLNKGESGLVTLYVKYEGETQGNVYQNTIADISLQFAVELGSTKTVVKTGDENNLIPYYIGMIVAGLLFLYFALDAYTDKLYKKRGKG